MSSVDALRTAAGHREPLEERWNEYFGHSERTARNECTLHGQRVDSGTCADGRSLSVPIVWFPRLAAAGSEARNTVELIGGGGEALHWPLLDENISVSGLLSGRASVEQRPTHA